MFRKKRECAHCGVEINPISHIRVWNENRLTPNIKYFCNNDCIVKYHLK